MTSMRAIPFGILTVLFAACGGPQGTRPEDMSAAAHREAAAREEEEAETHADRYDPSAQAPSVLVPTEANLDTFYTPEFYNPTDVHRERSVEHRALAEQHRAAATALEAFEEQECARFPPVTRAACPLLAGLEGVDEVPHGVLFRFASDAPPDAVADHMRCHVAFAWTRGHEGMNHCPLYVQGATVGKDALGVTLTTDAGADAVAELRQRAMAHLAQ